MGNAQSTPSHAPQPGPAPPPQQQQAPAQQQQPQPPVQPRQPPVAPVRLGVPPLFYHPTAPPAVPPPSLFAQSDTLQQTQANGLRPGSRRNLRHWLSISPIRDTFFRAMHPRNAMEAVEGLDIAHNSGAGPRLDLADYDVCEDRPCESPWTNVIPGRLRQPAGWVANPPIFEPAGHVHPPCGNEATQRLDTGRLKKRPYPVSWCQLPHNWPAALTHPLPNPKSPLVCKECKNRRYRDRMWRQKELWFGVCDDCETYFRDHYLRTATPHQRSDLRRCGCPPGMAQRHRQDPNTAWNPWRHMCQEHDRGMWTLIAADAQLEINRRRTIKRKTPRRKSPYGVRKRTTHKSSFQLKNLTPLERNREVSNVETPLQAVPRCFCGTVLRAADHNWDARRQGMYRVRNCVGCCEFVEADS